MLATFVFVLRHYAIGVRKLHERWIFIKGLVTLSSIVFNGVIERPRLGRSLIKCRKR